MCPECLLKIACLIQEMHSDQTPIQDEDNRIVHARRTATTHSCLFNARRNNQWVYHYFPYVVPKSRPMSQPETLG
jgi:hypothetical protein